MNTKRGWTSLSVPHAFAHRTQIMEKKETKEHACEVMELDWKQKQGNPCTGTERIGNYPNKDYTDMRPTTSIRVCNWKRLPPGRHLVNNIAKNRASNERVTQKEIKPPKGDEQATKAGEWRKLKVIFRKTTIPETTN
ncbi:unnamed protein product [Lactuca saligna]|uniref:Uncharacterized protein n=1 Tax=Lactuca saligna TaxID=75948 RepID=A0AA35ZUF7_LACSI|nr:unnamed protein product [Lactuca saligna]